MLILYLKEDRYFSLVLHQRSGPLIFVHEVIIKNISKYLCVIVWQLSDKKCTLNHFVGQCCFPN